MELKIEKKGDLYLGRVLSDEQKILWSAPRPMELRELYEEVWKRGYHLQAGIRVERNGILYSARILSEEQEVIWSTPHPVTLREVCDGLLERDCDLRDIYDAFNDMDPDWEKNNPRFYTAPKSDLKGPPHLKILGLGDGEYTAMSINENQVGTWLVHNPIPLQELYDLLRERGWSTDDILKAFDEHDQRWRRLHPRFRK